MDKITGPGNIFRGDTLQKQVYSIVGIDDLQAIRSDCRVLIVGCQSTYVAADLLAQAKHDTHALFITKPWLMRLEWIERRSSFATRGIARPSVENNGHVCT